MNGTCIWVRGVCGFDAGLLHKKAQTLRKMFGVSGGGRPVWMIWIIGKNKIVSLNRPLCNQRALEDCQNNLQKLFSISIITVSRLQGDEFTNLIEHLLQASLLRVGAGLRVEGGAGCTSWD